MSENPLFNLDEARSGYQPVRILFRGEEFTLGENAASVLAASKRFADLAEAERSDKGDVLSNMHAMVVMVCPEFGEKVAADSLDHVDNRLLMGALTEVLTRFNRLGFPKTEQE